MKSSIQANNIIVNPTAKEKVIAGTIAELMHIPLDTKDEEITNINNILIDQLPIELSNTISQNRYQCSLCNYQSCEACNVHMHLQAEHAHLQKTDKFFIKIYGRPSIARKMIFRFLNKNNLWLNITLKCPGNNIF